MEDRASLLRRQAWSVAAPVGRNLLAGATLSSGFARPALQPGRRSHSMRTEISQQGSCAEPRYGSVVPVFSRLERLAIAIGIKDGRSARSRSRIPGLFIFFASVKPASLANPRLEALRAYGELAGALFPQAIPVASLEEAGLLPPRSRKRWRLSAPKLAPDWPHMVHLRRNRHVSCRLRHGVCAART